MEHVTDKTERSSTNNRIKALIAKGKLQQAIDVLVATCEPLSEYHSREAILLSHRFYGLMTEISINGSISLAEVIQEKNKIAKGVLFLLEDQSHSQTEK